MTDMMIGRQLMELGPDDCRYPFGDSAPFTFCGDAAIVGSSYCELHHLICTKPPGHAQAMRDKPHFAAAIRKNNIPKCLVVSSTEDLQ
jgi:hypothetical protein